MNYDLEQVKEWPISANDARRLFFPDLAEVTIRLALRKHDIGRKVGGCRMVDKEDIAKLDRVVRLPKGNPAFCKGNYFGKPRKSKPKPKR